MPQPAYDAVTEALIKQRRLSSRDAAVARHVAGSEDSLQEARLWESIVRAINAELDRAKDPRVRAILLQELNKLQPQNLVGPRGIGDMMRPAEGPQPGQIYSDSNAGAAISFPGGFNAQDPGILNTPFRDPKLLQQYEDRSRDARYAPHGGPVRPTSVEM